MSVEFRPRKVSEYFDIARKRKWLILLPMIAVGLAIAYVVYRLPDIYESTTLIVVKPSTLPNFCRMPVSLRYMFSGTSGGSSFTLPAAS